MQNVFLISAVRSPQRCFMSSTAHHPDSVRHPVGNQQRPVLHTHKLCHGVAAAPTVQSTPIPGGPGFVLHDGITAEGKGVLAPIVGVVRSDRRIE